MSIVSLWGTGYNNKGQLGHGDTTNRKELTQIGTDTDWTLTACGNAHTMAIKVDGTLWATGDNGFGQLGLGDNTDRSTLTQVGTDTDWSFVACGDYHTVAIKTDGTLWSTGCNWYSQLGFGGSNINAFVQVGTDTDWSFVACGNYHTIVTKENGTLWCVGYNGDGQLGLGDNTDRSTLTQVGTDTDWSFVACFGHSIAIKTNGTLWATGGNYYGQLGLGDNTNRNEFTQVGADTDWSFVACGYSFTVAVKTGGTLHSTGYNNNGQLGLGDNVNKNIFTQVGADTDWSFVACGKEFTLAIKSGGTLWSTGNNGYGQLGLGNNVSKNTLNQIGIDTNWSFVACGGYHTIVLKTVPPPPPLTGICSTGRNDQGQLGLGDNTDRDVFTSLGIDNWKSIACGYNHTMLVMPGGTLWGTGDNSFGQLGLGDNIDRNEFTQIGTETDWDFVACGKEFTLAIKSDGTLWATGSNQYTGQLGLGDTVDRNEFTQVGTDTDWSFVDCGNAHTVALKSDGSLWSVGYNNNGQLGLGDYDNRHTFTQMGTDTDWNFVVCGSYHTIAIKSDKTLWGTGLNYHGQLGLGSSTFAVTVFTQLGTDTDWNSVFCGCSSCFTMAIKTDGTLWATGDNCVGQLGFGDYNSKYIFAQVGTDADWSCIACGGDWSLAVKTSGILLATGGNLSGQLGLGYSGSGTGETVFTQVGIDTDWNVVFCGNDFSVAIKGIVPPTPTPTCARFSSGLDSGVLFANKTLVGDRFNGKIYALNMNTYTDNGQPIRRVRRTQIINKERVNVLHHRLELEFEPGVGLDVPVGDPGENPTISLRWSDDGGNTWSDEIEVPIGKYQQYGVRAIWRRLGKSRNRIYEISTESPVKFVLIDAYANLEACKF